MNMLDLETWTVLSVAAAGFQTCRFILQKILSTQILSPAGATFARFVYSAPIIVLVLSIYVWKSGHRISFPGTDFLIFAVCGGIAQILATVCVVTLFKSRNFAVGITLMKTEVILSVLVGFLLLGEGIGTEAFIYIVIGLVGVLLLSSPPEKSGWRVREMANRGLALGLGAGVLFSVSAVCYRGASLEVASTDAVLRAGMTLATVTSFQMVAMALWLRWRDVGQLTAVWRARRVAAWIGLMSLAGSFCWFWAFSLQNAALVKAVGQVELIFSLIASRVIFGEKTSVRELLGIVVLGMSILLLVRAI